MKIDNLNCAFFYLKKFQFVVQLFLFEVNYFRNYICRCIQSIQLNLDFHNQLNRKDMSKALKFYDFCTKILNDLDLIATMTIKQLKLLLLKVSFLF